MLGGWSWSNNDGDKTEPSWGTFYPDYWIVKTDSLGNKQWDKRYGGTDDDRLYVIIQTSDGGYILGGITESGISGDKTIDHFDPANNYYRGDYWIIKIDSLGNKQWENEFGGNSLED